MGPSPATGGNAARAAGSRGAGAGGGAPPFAGTVLGSIEVSAGGLARDHTIVTFPPLNHGRGGKNLVLVDAQNDQLPRSGQSPGRQVHVRAALPRTSGTLRCCGEADAALLERLWNDYATPPTVTILR